MRQNSVPIFLFSTTTPSPPIYTLSLHGALPISCVLGTEVEGRLVAILGDLEFRIAQQTRIDVLLLDAVELERDRKSTRLNSSHVETSYAVFCLKKKNTQCPCLVASTVCACRLAG